MALQEYTGQQDNKHRQGKHHTHTQGQIYLEVQEMQKANLETMKYIVEMQHLRHTYGTIYLGGGNLVSCHIVLK